MKSPPIVPVCEATSSSISGTPPCGSSHLEPPRFGFSPPCVSPPSLNSPPVQPLPLRRPLGPYSPSGQLSSSSAPPGSQFFDMTGTISAQHVNVGSYPTWYADPYAYWNFNPPSSLPSYNGTNSHSASFQSPSPHCGTSSAHYLFWVYKLNNRITTCFGCRGKFTRAADGGIPVPPLDLILKCNESWQY